MFQTPRQSEQQERISDDVLCFDLKWRQGLGKVEVLAEAGNRGGIGVQFLARSSGGSGMFARSKVLRLSWACRDALVHSAKSGSPVTEYTKRQGGCSVGAAKFLIE